MLPVPGDLVRHKLDLDTHARLYRVVRAYRPPYHVWCLDLEAVVRAGEFDGGPIQAELVVVVETSWVDRLLAAMLFVGWAADDRRRFTEGWRLAGARIDQMRREADAADRDFGDE